MSLTRVGVALLVVVLVVTACGSDDAAGPLATSAPRVTTEAAEAPSTTAGSTTSTAATTSPPTTAPDETATTVAATSTTSAATDDASAGPLCAAFEGLFIAGLVSSFAAFDDPANIDPLLLGFMPALSARFDSAVATLPLDGVSPEFEQALREAAAVFDDAAAAVRAAGVSDADVERLGSVLDPEVLEGGPADDDMGDLISDDVLDRLAGVDFDLDAALADVPEPDEAQLAVLCPSLADFLGVGGASIEDACSVVDDLALAVVFGDTIPAFDPDDVGTGMCVWDDDTLDRELVVSVTDRATVDAMREGNEDAFDVVELPGLGDEAWVIDGLLSGTSSTGGRGGFGDGRATVGVIDGARGLLVAVRAPDGDPAALAADVATVLLGG